MAQCKWCERSGWFLSLSQIGLCKQCHAIVTLEVSQRSRIIDESLKLVRESKKLETRLSRCELVIQHVNELSKYDRREIPTLQRPLSDILEDCDKLREAIIVESLTEETENVMRRVGVAVTVRTKVNQLNKLILRIREYRGKCAGVAELDGLEQRVKNTIHQVQLYEYLDAASRAEFKGNKKAALDSYYDALYLLRHDEIDDALQADHIQTLEQKIVELGGTPPK